MRKTTFSVNMKSRRKATKTCRKRKRNSKTHANHSQHTRQVGIHRQWIFHRLQRRRGTLTVHLLLPKGGMTAELWLISGRGLGPNRSGRDFRGRGF